MHQFHQRKSNGQNLHRMQYPKFAFSAITISAVAGRFSTRSGFGIPFGKVKSGSWFTLMKSSGAPFFARESAMASKVGPAAPLPLLTTIFRGLSFDTSINFKIAFTYFSLRLV